MAVFFETTKSEEELIFFVWRDLSHINYNLSLRTNFLSNIKFKVKKPLYFIIIFGRRKEKAKF